MQVNFSGAFDRVSHSRLLCKFQASGVGRTVLPTHRRFLIDRKIRVLLDGTHSPYVDVVSSVPQGIYSILGPLLFVLFTTD